MTLHEMILRLQTFLPSVRMQLEEQIALFTPLLSPAFPENRYAQLLTLFCLTKASHGNVPGARKLLDRLRPICETGSDAEKALGCVLDGLCHMQSGHDAAMAAAFDEAGEFNHAYHLPYMLSAEYHLLSTHLYDLALERYDKAINCIYGAPPLDERCRYVIGQAQASMAACLVMMHRYEEAAGSLRKAEIASDSAEYQHALALLSALKKDRDAAEKALAALKALESGIYETIASHVRLLLEDRHIHFFTRPVAPQQPEDFWRWFRAQEDALFALLDKGDTDGCGDMLAEHINTIVPEEEDRMYASIEVPDGQPEIILTACYSRSYAALIEALANGCPEDIRSRWRITLHP